MLIDSGNEQLDIIRDDVIAMATAAQDFGSYMHATGGQRAFVLFTGMGVIDDYPKAKTMEKLAISRFEND